MFILLLFCLSYIPMLHRQIRINLNVVSPIYIYCMFSFIYVFFTNLYLHIESTVVNIEMELLDLEHANLMLVFVLVTNIIIYLSLIFLPTKITNPIMQGKIDLRTNLGNFPKYLFVIIYPITLGLVILFPWPLYDGEVTIFNSIASFSKSILLVVFCSLSLSRRGDDVSRLLFLSVFLLLMIVNFIDTARTQLFIAFFVYLFAERVNIITLLKRFYLFIVFFLFFVYLTLERSGITFSFELLLWPIYSEAIFGSYGALQAIAIVKSGLWEVTSPVYYFLDFMKAIFPTIIFEVVDYESYLTGVVEVANTKGVFSGQLYPLGGNFFVSDYLIYFGLFGPLFFSMFFLMYAYFISKLPAELYVFCVSSFFLVVKAPLIVLAKTSILGGLAFLLFIFLYTLIPKKLKIR
jgi:hypothetical protein